MSLSEIGKWSEVKLDIIREYATAYSIILNKQKQPELKHVILMLSRGQVIMLLKKEGFLVWGSPFKLLVDPPFTAYHLIDLDRGYRSTGNPS